MRNDLIRVLQRCACAALLLLLAQTSKAQYTNGIYAEFNTSMGNYTCRLEYAIAPKACANFIGLATGTRAWLDETTGITKTNALYNGVIFHRVISNFMNQAGSPTGIGTGGPGFVITDEFSPSLRHDSFGVLSMANSGPDSSGSQFFITVAARPDLNDKYSVFGKIFGGSNVVSAINRVATDANDRPLTNVVLNSIAIRRIGTVAQAFNIQTNGLPIVTNLNLKIATSGPNVILTFSNKLYADNRLYSSSELVNWTPSQMGIETSSPVVQSNLQIGSLPNRFFRAAQIQYASSTFAPKSVSGRTYTLFYTVGSVATNIIMFNSGSGGTYNYNGTSGTILGYNWLQSAYNGRLIPIGFSGLSDHALALNYHSATNGTFTGGVYPLGYPIALFAFGVSGTFTNTP